MTREDIDLLMSPGMRDAIERSVGRDPLEIAYDKSLPHAGSLATQVKYLQRAERKLPSYYAARCIIPSLAFEQSSSEATAFNRRFSGRLAVDLTCGLGVDSYALSRRFDEVIAVEKDPVLAYLAEVNFRLLGASNVRVVNMSAEEFVASAPHLHADLIFADPDRRGRQGQKLVMPQECRPDTVGLMPMLLDMADRVAVKLSPMFDVDEAFRLYGNFTRVEVVSLDGECKEVVVELGSATAPVVAATMIGYGTVEFADRTPPALNPESPARFGYMVAPDVAFAKARVARRFFGRRGYYIDDDSGYAFTDDRPESVPGRAYRIVSVERYSPRNLKKILREQGIRRAEIHKRNFPYPTSQIVAQLGIAEGGSQMIAFTRSGGESWAIFIEEL